MTSPPVARSARGASTTHASAGMAEPARNNALAAMAGPRSPPWPAPLIAAYTSTTTASVARPESSLSACSRRGTGARTARPTTSGTRTTSAKRPTSSPTATSPPPPASAPSTTGPSSADTTSEPASPPSASTALPPASATNPTAATSVDDTPSASTPSRTTPEKSRLISQASGVSATNGTSTRMVSWRLCALRPPSRAGAMPSAVNSTKAASTMSERRASMPDGATSASAAATAASASSQSPARSSARPSIGRGGLPHRRFTTQRVGAHGSTRSSTERLGCDVHDIRVSGATPTHVCHTDDLTVTLSRERLYIADTASRSPNTKSTNRVTRLTPLRECLHVLPLLPTMARRSPTGTLHVSHRGVRALPASWSARRKAPSPFFRRRPTDGGRLTHAEDPRGGHGATKQNSTVAPGHAQAERRRRRHVRGRRRWPGRPTRSRRRRRERQAVHRGVPDESPHPQPVHRRHRAPEGAPADRSGDVGLHGRRAEPAAPGQHRADHVPGLPQQVQADARPAPAVARRPGLRQLRVDEP